MTKPRDPQALLTAYLAAGMEVLPDRVVDAVLDEVHRTRQRSVFGPRSTRSMFRGALSAAAVVAALVVGGALLLQRDRDDVAAPSATPEASGSPSEPAVVTAPTPSPTAEILSLELAWTKVDLDAGPRKVVWLGDRFVMVDDDAVIRTSTDGASWNVLQPGDPDPGYADLVGAYATFVSWEDNVVGWWNPEAGPDVTGKPPITARDIVRIIRPPAEPTNSTPFKGRIESIGLGPAGIVAQVQSHLDWDAWVASKLGDDWVSRYKGVDFKDGILEITMKPGQGRGLKVVWADEGFEPGDYQDGGFSWYSPDGQQWTNILGGASASSDRGRGLTGLGEIVGVSDGFIARGNDTGECPGSECAGIWHSSDGLTWRNVGNVTNKWDGAFVPWQGGALVTDGVEHFDFWTSHGHSDLPMAADVRAAWKQPKAGFGVGPLGLVTVLKDDGEILVTHDGIDSAIQAMPAEMAADSTLRYDTPSVAVGERSVVVVMWSGTHEFRIPSLWVGSVAP